MASRCLLSKPGRERDRDGVSLVLGTANRASFPSWPGSDRRRQRQPAPSGRAFDKRDVVGSLRQVPESGQLTCVQKTRSAERREDSQVRRRRLHSPGYEAVARGNGEWSVRGRKPIQAGLDLGACNVGGRNHCQTQFSAARFALQLLLDQSRIVELLPSIPHVRGRPQARGRQQPDDQKGDRQPFASLPRVPDIEPDQSGDARDRRWIRLPSEVPRTAAARSFCRDRVLQRQALVGARPVR